MEKESIKHLEERILYLKTSNHARILFLSKTKEELFNEWTKEVRGLEKDLYSLELKQNMRIFNQIYSNIK